MKLIISECKMKIVTETIQDVVYLKKMGCLSDNKDICLKVSVYKTKDEELEGVEIDVKWEDINCGSCDGGSRTFVECAYSCDK